VAEMDSTSLCVTMLNTRPQTLHRIGEYQCGFPKWKLVVSRWWNV